MGGIHNMQLCLVNKITQANNVYLAQWKLLSKCHRTCLVSKGITSHELLSYICMYIYIHRICKHTHTNVHSYIWSNLYSTIHMDGCTLYKQKSQEMKSSDNFEYLTYISIYSSNNTRHFQIFIPWKQLFTCYIHKWWCMNCSKL